MNRGSKKFFDGIGKHITSQLPEGIAEVELTDDVISHGRRGSSIRYDGLVNALREAGKRGKGIVVDAEKYWPGAESRDIYVSIYRIGKKHGLRIGQDRTKLEQGAVVLWVKGEREPQDNKPTRRKFGRPAKVAA